MKEIKIAFVIIGAIIGAGFASGKEIFEYFAKYGVSSLLYLIPLFFCFYIFTRIYLSFGAKFKEFDLANTNKFLSSDKKIFGYKINMLNVVMFCTFLILSSAMFSGLYALIKTYVPNLNGTVVFIIVISITFIMIKIPFSALSKISYVLVPAIILGIIINTVFTFNTGYFATNFGEISILPLPFLTLLYASQNMFLASFVVIKSGSKLNKKQRNIVSLLVATFLCLLIALGILCFMFNPRIAYADMPFAEISMQISPVFSLIFAIIIFSAIITTYATTLSSLKEYFNGKKKYNNHLFMLVIIALLSLVNFSTIVELLYPVIGMFGVYYLFLLRKKQNYELRLTIDK